MTHRYQVSRERYIKSEKGKIAQDRYVRSEKGKVRQRRAVAAYKSRNPERAAAHRAVERAILAGRLVRPRCCGECGRSGKVEAHHHRGYERGHWLDVVWCCRGCHRRAHV